MKPEQIAQQIVQRLEKLYENGAAVYISTDLDETGCEYDGHLNVLQIVEWTLELSDPR